MSKALVIAEKPSVAADLARALGKFERKKDYFEREDMVISSAIGHLVELCLPGELDKKRGKWSFANLPIIPDEFDLKPIEKTKTRLNLLKKLMKRSDVTELVNACDAGREGELIFRYLVRLCGVKKPVKRLWLQSMTPEAIRMAFQRLREDEEMIPLAKAATSRSESDWLVGINSTRAMTAFNSKIGGFQLTPVGRVQTPTLAILVEREEKIRRFKPRTYFEVHGDFQVASGLYQGRWFDETFRKGDDEEARAERIWEAEKAEAIQARCQGKEGRIDEKKKPTTQAPPLLYDLTSLQREAHGRYGFSARRTLQLAQQLYERYKVLTYPRTDSRYLPEDHVEVARRTLGQIDGVDLREHARKVLAQDWVRPNKRIFNNAKVSDHNAIIPTGHKPGKLEEAHWKIYDLVTRRFIAVFYPTARFEVTTRITRIGEDAFKTEGRVIVDPGWLAVYGRKAEGEGSGEGKVIAPVKEGESALAEKVEVRENQTKPPPRYSEATLLSAMEGAGKLVDDEDLRDAMDAKGLGTPATRAAIIEGLIYDKYINREARELVATAKGIDLIHLLRGLGVEALCSPEMTGEWEYKLKQMEQGGLRRKEFMGEIRKLTEDIVNRAKNFTGETVDGDYVDLEAKCPKCGGGPFKEEFKLFKCKSCELIIWKTLAGRQFEPEELKQLLEEGNVGPLEGFRSKMGRPFDAKVILNEEFKPTFEFDNNGAEDIKEIDFSQYEKIGPCPVCEKGAVYALDKQYVCDQAAGKTCSFRMGRTILQREISQDQVRNIIERGKTDLLQGFVSKKGRPFSAFLVLKDGKVGFEFEPRKKAAKSGASKAAKQAG